MKELWSRQSRNRSRSWLFELTWVRSWLYFCSNTNLLGNNYVSPEFEYMYHTASSLVPPGLVGHSGFVAMMTLPTHLLPPDECCAYCSDAMPPNPLPSALYCHLYLPFCDYVIKWNFISADEIEYEEFCFGKAWGTAYLEWEERLFIFRYGWVASGRIKGELEWWSSRLLLASHETALDGA